MWLGSGWARSARWAANAGLKLLLGNLTAANGHSTFEGAQRALQILSDIRHGVLPALGWLPRVTFGDAA